MTEMKGTPRNRRTAGFLEIVACESYDPPCAEASSLYPILRTDPRIISRYRTILFSYRTTPLMVVPDQPSPVVPLTEQPAEEDRSEQPPGRQAQPKVGFHFSLWVERGLKRFPPSEYRVPSALRLPVFQ